MDFSLEISPDLIAVFLTLFVLEIVLGVDNVIFISILASKLPVAQRARARNLGLTLIYGPRAFAVLVEVLSLIYAARKAKRDAVKRHAVQLRPRYPLVDENTAVDAALSTGPDSGSVGLSRRPVAGDRHDHDPRARIG